MNTKTNGKRGLRIAGIALVVTTLTAISAKSIPPPPPSGPPAPLLIGISVSGSTAVDEETTAQYACIGNYSDGTHEELLVVWDVDSSFATISDSGLLSAENVSSDQNATITATYGGFMATLEIDIQYVAPVLSSIAISGPVEVTEETAAQYVCTAIYSDGASEVVTPTWSENSSYATISSSGSLSAGNVLADQSVVITASYGGKSDTHGVTIKDIPAVLTAIAISGPTSLNEETTAQYICTASYSDGSSVVVSPDWSENSSSTTISSSGTLAADNVSADQSVTITASYDGRSDTHVVLVRYVAPTLTGIAISGLTQVDEESSAWYVCTATYSDGTSEVVVPTWSENTTYATINASGYLATGDVAVDQGFIITARYGDQVDTHAATIKFVAPPVVLTGITIVGADSVEENATAQFVCTAHYSDESSTAVTPVWSEDSESATMSVSGLLTAGNIESDEHLTITATFGGKTASQSVEIWVVGTQVSFPLSGFGTIKADLWDEAAQELCEEFDATFDPDELVITSMELNRWYRLRIYEYDTETKLWVLVHTNWICM